MADGWSTLMVRFELICFFLSFIIVNLTNYLISKFHSLSPIYLLSSKNLRFGDLWSLLKRGRNYCLFCWKSSNRYNTLINRYICIIVLCYVLISSILYNAAAYPTSHRYLKFAPSDQYLTCTAIILIRSHRQSNSGNRGRAGVNKLKRANHKHSHS